ncbi:hypothetical protein C7M84_010223 [Penaeus vannamei]|uniref:Uncharacterized protein n=1 Tax=Penaeus vannamei TaxID=6689 RepID=A0A423T4I8_PENVA|nr:hypothetical protein C7M84_010223 [Penaeus vannamei]
MELKGRKRSQPDFRRASLTPGASVLQGRTAAGRGGCSPPALAPRVPQQGLLSLLLDPADLLLEGAHLLLFKVLPHPSELLLEGADVLLPAPNPQAARIRARVGLDLVPGGEPKEFALAVCQELGQEVLSGRDEVAAVGAPSRGQPAQDVLDLLLELLEVALASENFDIRVVSVHVNPDPMQILQLLDPAASQADDGAAPLLSQGHGEPVAAVRAEAVAAVLLRSLAGDPGSFRSHRKDYNKYKLLGFSGRLYGESGGAWPPKLATSTSHHRKLATSTSHHRKLATSTNHHRKLATSHHRKLATSTSHHRKLATSTSHHRTLGQHQYQPPQDIGNQYQPPQEFGNQYQPPQDIGSQYQPPQNVGNQYQPPQDIGNQFQQPQDVGNQYHLPPVVNTQYSAPTNIEAQYQVSKSDSIRYQNSRAQKQVVADEYQQPKESSSDCK